MASPVRSCVGCRTRRPRHHLLRAVVDGDGALVPAPRGGRDGARGRSYYFCPARACFTRALGSRTGNRVDLVKKHARGGSITADRDLLWSALRQSLTTEIELLNRTSHGDEASSRVAGLHNLQAAMAASARGG